MNGIAARRMSNRLLARILTLLGLLGAISGLTLSGCSGGSARPDAGTTDAGTATDADLGLPPTVTAARWEAADTLFLGDTRWLGGDAAYSVALGGDRVVWLFGDSFIATSSARRRSESVMVRNSVGLQVGLDPLAAPLSLYWSEPDGPSAPEAFFAEPLSAETWLWPLDGVLLDGRLLLFFSRVAGASGGLGFEGVDWQARVVDNPEDPPDLWHVRSLAAPPNPWRIFLGTAVVAEGAFVYCFGMQEPSHDLFLYRVLRAAAAQGQLTEGQWYCGDGRFSPLCAPVAVVQSGAPELSVHRDTGSGYFVMVETVGFGAAELAVRTAPRLEGPWTSATPVFRPVESGWPDALVYAGKAHPELLVAAESGDPTSVSGSELAVTYVANSLDFSTLVSDTRYYFPRFVRLRLATGTQPAP